MQMFCASVLTKRVVGSIKNMDQKQFQTAMSHMIGALPDEIHSSELALLIATLVSVFEQGDMWESVSKAVEELIHVQIDVENAAKDADDFLEKIVNGEDGRHV